MSNLENNKKIENKSSAEQMIDSLFKKFKNNELNRDIKMNGLENLLTIDILKKLNKSIPNFNKYIDILKKDNILIIKMSEAGIPREFVDTRFTALTRFIKGIDKKFIILNTKNNAYIAGLIEEAWHIKNPKGSMKEGIKFENKFELLNYIDAELKSSIFGNLAGDIILNRKTNLVNEINRVIEIELLPHFNGGKEELKKIIFNTYKVKNIEDLIIKIKEKI